MISDCLVGVSTKTKSIEDMGVVLLSGRFSGLAIKGPDTECPLILTSSSSSGVTYLEVIGMPQHENLILTLFVRYQKVLRILDITGDVYRQKIPISAIPTDVQPFSEIDCISFDNLSNVSIFI